MSVFATQSISRVDEDHLDLSLGREVSYPLETRSLECRATIAFVFEHPLLGYFQLVGLRELDQRRRLTRDRVLLPIPVKGVTDSRSSWSAENYRLYSTANLSGIS